MPRLGHHRYFCSDCAQVVEEIFYPAVREAIDDDDLLDEAEVEHATAKSLIAQLQQMLPADNLYDAKVKVLSEYIENHVKEEEDEMFPKARTADLDLTSGAPRSRRLKRAGLGGTPPLPEQPGRETQPVKIEFCCDPTPCDFPTSTTWNH